MKLLLEHGLEGITSREIAREAGVNEVTVFRRFGDKATLTSRALDRVNPAPLLDGRQPRIDPSTGARASEGLVACLRDLRQVLLDRPQALMLQPHPELANLAVATVEAARSFLERALSEARLQLRPEVDVRASAVVLQALVFMTVAWQQEPRLRLHEREWDRLFESSIRPLVRGL